MYQELLNTLRNFTPFSIIVSAIVIFIVFLCVFVIFSFAKQEKRIEQLRWNKVSNHMVLRDVQSGEWIPLEADEILIGRHGSADIRLPDMSISRYHAVLYVSNGIWRVVDLDSKSGTFVNGVKIDHQAILKPMDEICFGTQAVIIQQRRNANVS
ncbi:MAG: FHA domain-containing protein [Oscillospiraceae bacterium]|nr:FHA domain-containing protein [Oscillospiraceae bacterium]MDD7294223.1 FHA domain-containing protein [Oscillospiraceae bacterium]MDY2510930.1 FHA domain-containing protein [Ruminococcus callidus]